MSALSDQPPPRKGAKSGYYPDPLGGPHARWWDGSAWNLRLGPRVPPDAPRNRALAPATKTCRHCGVQSETFEGTCPNCRKPYGQSNGWVIAAIAIACVLFVLFLGGCAVLFGALVGGVHRSHAISQREFDSVALGSMRTSVEGTLGSPYESDQVQDRTRGPVTCIYYHQEGERRYSRAYYGFCFARGRLFSKWDHD
jgi:hypothetical protein